MNVGAEWSIWQPVLAHKELHKVGVNAGAMRAHKHDHAALVTQFCFIIIIFAYLSLIIFI